MLRIVPTARFRKDFQKLKRSGNKDMSKLARVINMIASGEPLPLNYHDHRLSGDKKRFRECHVEPDWLLMYEIKSGVLVLSLVRTGSHSEIL